MSDEQAASEIHRALRHFGADLPRGRSFDYDEWVAALYILWYQPNQIHSAYRLLGASLDELKDLANESRTLLIVDFACGAGAMTFGIALALADAVLNLDVVPPRPFLPKIQICCIDKSRAMVRIGQKVWDEFKCIVDAMKYDEPLLPLFTSSQGIAVKWTISDTQSIVKALTEIPLENEQRRIVSLMHGVYEDNQRLMSRRMHSLTDVVQPSVILMSCHDDATSKSRTLSAVGSFAQQLGYQKREIQETPALLVGDLDQLTRFRRQVFDQYVKPYERTLSETDVQFVEQYLTTRPVEWIQNKAAFFCYRRW